MGTTVKEKLRITNSGAEWTDLPIEAITNNEQYFKKILLKAEKEILKKLSQKKLS